MVITLDEILLQINMHWLLLSLNIQNSLSCQRLLKKRRCLTPLKSRSPLQIPKHGSICFSVCLKNMYLPLTRYLLFETKFNSWKLLLNNNIHWGSLPKISLWNRYLTIGLCYYLSKMVFRGHKFLYFLKTCWSSENFPHSMGKKILILILWFGENRDHIP